MALLAHKEGSNIIMLDNVLGRQMIDVCHEADAVDRMYNTIDKEYWYSDRVYEIVHHLGSTVVVPL